MSIDDLYIAVAPMMQQIYKLDFNQQLALGRLPQNIFAAYLQQDALFLADMAKALAIVAARVPCNVDAQRLLEFALSTIKEEQVLQSKYLHEYGVTPLRQKDKNMACFAYTNYILKSAALDSPVQALAALHSCPWVYHEVGKYLQTIAVTNNTYKEWLDLYSGEAFAIAVADLECILQQLLNDMPSIQDQAVIDAFVSATQLELQFWQDV